MLKYLPLSLLFMASPITAYAGWPTFQVVSATEVMQKVITEGCPTGEGYIPSGTQFQIQSRYIPSNQTWYWTYTGTSRCQKLPEHLQDLKYMFFDQSGRYPGSTLNTIYGSDTAGPLFTFTFTVPSEPYYWDCGPFVGHEPPIIIGCAGDMR